METLMTYFIFFIWMGSLLILGYIVGKNKAMKFYIEKLKEVNKELEAIKNRVSIVEKDLIK